MKLSSLNAEVGKVRQLTWPKQSPSAGRFRALRVHRVQGFGEPVDEQTLDGTQSRNQKLGLVSSILVCRFRFSGSTTWCQTNSVRVRVIATLQALTAH